MASHGVLPLTMQACYLIQQQAVGLLSMLLLHRGGGQSSPIGWGSLFPWTPPALFFPGAAWQWLGLSRLRCARPLAYLLLRSVPPPPPPPKEDMQSCGLRCIVEV